MESKVSNPSERIQEAMRLKGYKQVDVVERASAIGQRYGVKFSKSSLSQYIHGVHIPDQNKLLVLAMALDVSEGWLLGYDVPSERMTHTLESSIEKDRIIEWITTEANDIELLDIITAATAKLKKRSK